MSTPLLSVGVIGGGVVGTAVSGFFKDGAVYDAYKESDPIESVLKTDVIFICVPTPYEEGFDRSALEDAFSHFKDVPEGKIVVIKSTSIPGTTQYFQEQYPHITVLFNPEFLTEKTAQADFLKPDKQLVGYVREKDKAQAEKVLDMLPDAPYKVVLPAQGAELVKYAINSYYANKVVFGNMLYDLAESLRVPYEDVKAAFVSDQRITDSHFDVLHGGYRGYGGKCLPKDVRALRDFAQSKGVDASLLESMEHLNEIYKNS